MNEVDFIRTVIAKPHFYHRVISVLGDDAKHAQIKRAMANDELFERFISACNRRYVSLAGAIENKRPGDYIVYIRELDLYGLCNKDELAHLSLCLRTMQTVNANTFIPLFDFSDRPIESLSADERLIYEEDKRREAALAAASTSMNASSAPKISVCQVILACDACKLVFCCVNPNHADTIKRRIRERWATVATSTTNADGEIEITVDSKHANFEEARKFYTEITNALTFSDREVAKSMREMLLTNNGNGLYSWMAAFDAKLENMVAQIKTIADKPTVVNNTIGTVNGNVVQNATNVASTSAAASTPNPEQIARDWVIGNPPGATEGSGAYFKRYCAAITNYRVTNRKMFHVLNDVGFKQVKTLAARLWRKK